ncbi:carbon-nitrogen hydrolase family protein [Polymorphobacter arshaanensis]|uniref:Carbon-nitrogen hydrolase family protein n=1 Tax=Glacieibacterium arshaanense TaxID=2511025 RepID=A0A4Y9EPB2_9SPHN|nr:carbon-nitrogen hydrolase family protein [Polymorphobacter arshaanensis]TFU03906.1 carbon-nitrogen hydrolase family protein [Polymorphobacter arshaanensis]
MRLGIVQTNSGIDPTANAEMLVAAIAELATGGAQLVLTPEMSGLLDRDRTRIMTNVRVEADDVVLAAVIAAARQHGVWVELGSLAISVGEDRLANRSFLIDAQGEIRARYDKIHLFDVDLPTGERHRESATYRPGAEAVVVDTPWARLGLAICYDLRFAGLFAALANAGAQLLTVPAAFTRPTGKAHWHALLRARAIETGSFVVAAAQSGEHQDGRATYGHSLVIDPWGEVLLDMGEAAGTAICDIDLGAVADTRARIPALVHARPFTLVPA